MSWKMSGSPAGSVQALESFPGLVSQCAGEAALPLQVTLHKNECVLTRLVFEGCTPYNKAK